MDTFQYLTYTYTQIDHSLLSAGRSPDISRLGIDVEKLTLTRDICGFFDLWTCR